MRTRLKLNSIRYGPRVLAVIGILLLAVPLILYLCYSLLMLIGLRVEVLLRLLSLSLMGGIGLLGLFVFLLVIELVQDRVLDRQYRKTRNRKVKISDEYYECQYCGYQRVRQSDKRCKICDHDLV